MAEKSKKDKVDLKVDLEVLKNTLDKYVTGNNAKDKEIQYTASLFLNWLNTKTNLINNEKSFKKPDDFELKRGKVVWVDFGFNIGTEFGGKHPAVILRVSGEKVFVVPLSSQKPDDPSKDMFVEVDKVYQLKPMKRWVNVLNMVGVSVQRIDFTNSTGRVNGKVLDNISNALNKVGIK